MTQTADAAVTVMSFFPSLVAFVVSFMALFLTAPASPPVLPFALVIVLVAALIFVARPLYMIWSRTLYELHDRSPRLLAKKNSRPSNKTYLAVIRTSLLAFNLILIVVSVLVFWAPRASSILQALPIAGWL